MQPQLILPTSAFSEDFERFVHTQQIPAEFLDRNAQMRLDSLTGSMGDVHQQASIPTAVVDIWKRQGFDVMQESNAACLARLRKENLEHFITTKRQF